MKPIEAYIAAGYQTNTRERLAIYSSKMNGYPHVKARILELQNRALTNLEKTSITSLHEDAINKARELLGSDNPNIVAKMISEILSRTEPIVRQSQNLNITVNSKDQEKRRLLLDKKCKEMGVIKVEQIEEGK